MDQASTYSVVPDWTVDDLYEMDPTTRILMAKLLGVLPSEIHRFTVGQLHQRWQILPLYNRYLIYQRLLAHRLYS